MVLLHGINDNITIPCMYYSGVYQDVAKNESSKSDIFLGGQNQTKTNDKMMVHISPSTLVISFFQSSHCAIE